MSNHNTERNRRFPEREQEESDRRRYEDERMVNQRRDFRNEEGQRYPTDQSRYSQGGYGSDEYDTGYSGNAQRDYGQYRRNEGQFPEGGDYARGSGGYGRQEMSSRYQRGNYGRSTDHGREGQSDWRTGNPRHHEDYGRGGYQQSYDNRWDSSSQRDDWRTGRQEQGGYRQSGNQGYGYRGQQQSGMGGTYEGEFGPEAGSQNYGTGGSEWSYTEIWMIPGPMSGRGPEGYQRSDERIKEDVCERLSHHGQLDASKVRINVQNGEVTLEGEVESRGAKRMAEDAVDSVSGVRDVHNQLRVQQGEGQTRHTGTNSESLPKGKGSMTEATGQPQSNGQATMSGSGTSSTTETGNRSSQTTGNKQT
jgi:osmotically-inducible protein OsmY